MLLTRLVRTRRSVMLNPRYLTTNQSEECPWADHTLLHEHSSWILSRMGNNNLKSISSLWPSLPGKARKLFLFYVPPNSCLSVSMLRQWTEAGFLQHHQLDSWCAAHTVVLGSLGCQVQTPDTILFVRQLTLHGISCCSSLPSHSARKFLSCHDKVGHKILMLFSLSIHLIS